MSGYMTRERRTGTLALIGWVALRLTLVGDGALGVVFWVHNPGHRVEAMAGWLCLSALVGLFACAVAAILVDTAP